MEIHGSIPFHLAQAYAARPAGGAMHIGTLQSPAGLSASPGLNIAGQARHATRSPLIDRIVGAIVHRPMEFDGAATVSPSASLQLYTRAADKVEAAVAVNVGRAIDITA